LTVIGKFQAIFVALAVSAGVSHAASKLNVVTTTEDLAAITREIGGDRADVDSIAKGYQDPHFVEPKPSFLLKLQKADLLEVVGLQLEIGWLPPLQTQSRNSKIQEGGPGYYHPGETPTTDGAIPDAFWRMPGVQRSLDPTHAFAAWGKDSLRYTRFHHRTLTMGPESPLGLLQRDGGYGLLLGVGYYANTFHHVVEMSTAAPCLGRRSEAYPVILPDAASHITAACRKYDSFAMWHANAAWWPNQLRLIVSAPARQRR